MALWVEFTCVLDLQLLFVLLSLLIDSLCPLNGQFSDLFEIFMTVFSDFILVLKFETLIPFLFVQIEQHLLFELVCSVVDVDGVIVLVQALVHCLN